MIQKGIRYLGEEKNRVSNYANRAFDVVKNSVKLAISNTLSPNIRENLSLCLDGESSDYEYGDIGVKDFLLRRECGLVAEENKEIPDFLSPFNETQIKNLFLITENYLARKYIFENICIKYCQDFQGFKNTSYDQNIDFILGKTIAEGENSFQSVCNILNEKKYSKEELNKFFQIFGILHAVNENEKTKIIQNQVVEIIENHEGMLKYLDEELLIEYINNGNIDVSSVHDKDERVYVKIPSIISGSYGENSGIINFLTGFIKSHYPTIYKDSKRRESMIKSIVGDTKKIPLLSGLYKKSIKKVKTKYGGIIKKGSEIGSVLKEKSSQITKYSGDKIFRGILKTSRFYRNIDEETIDVPTHEHVLKKHIDFKSYLSAIEGSQQLNQTKKSATHRSAIYSFVYGRGKAKLLAPLINSFWTRAMRVKIAKLVVGSMRIIKLKNIVWLGTYLGIEKLKNFIGEMPVSKKYQIGKESYNGFKITQNPILLRFFLENSDKIDSINNRISNIQELKKMRTISRDLENQEQLLVNSISIPEGMIQDVDIDLGPIGADDAKEKEKIQLQISLLEAEIQTIREKLFHNPVGKEKDRDSKNTIKQELNDALLKTHDYLNSPLQQG